MAGLCPEAQKVEIYALKWLYKLEPVVDTAPKFTQISKEALLAEAKAQAEYEERLARERNAQKSKLCAIF